MAGKEEKHEQKEAEKQALITEIKARDKDDIADFGKGPK